MIKKLVGKKKITKKEWNRRRHGTKNKR